MLSKNMPANQDERDTGKKKSKKKAARDFKVGYIWYYSIKVIWNCACDSNLFCIYLYTFLVGNLDYVFCQYFVISTYNFRMEG